jgi:2-iminobutanoate/2-iminopropanoate deaminase
MSFIGSRTNVQQRLLAVKEPWNTALGKARWRQSIAGGPMPKQQIRSDRLRQPCGVFSHATAIEATGRLVFISGMTSRRADGTIAGIGDIEAQTRQVCENIKAAVEAAGGTMDDICRVDVYIRNMEQFDAIHKVRREYFREPLPASTMVEVVKMTHPDYLIEINAIAVIP